MLRQVFFVHEAITDEMLDSLMSHPPFFVGTEQQNIFFSFEHVAINVRIFIVVIPTFFLSSIGLLVEKAPVNNVISIHVQSH